jgi:hypothetical protein
MPDEPPATTPTEIQSETVPGPVAAEVVAEVVADSAPVPSPAQAPVATPVPPPPSAPTSPGPTGSTNPAPLVGSAASSWYDVAALIGVGLVGAIVLVLFGFAIVQQGLLNFPAPLDDNGLTAYIDDSLIYRERRLALSLSMRTFITGLSFVVGLALCTMGGMFILRQVIAYTQISASWGDPTQSAAETEARLGVMEAVKKGQFAFTSYSPGVVFMLGGVAVMALTQWLAIPIRAVEVFPAGSVPFCQDDESVAHEVCPDVLGQKGGGQNLGVSTRGDEAALAVEITGPPHQ